MAKGHKNDFAYSNTGQALVEFFSKAGSLFASKKHSYHGDETSALELFKPAWVTNSYKSMQLAMWLRDARGGSGNRSGFREVIGWIANRNPEWIKANMHFVPEVGRWDDLSALMDTPCESEALEFWVRAIQEGHGLAAKWAPRGSSKNGKREIFNKLRKTAGMTPKQFRKLIVKNTNVIETAMCQKEWQDIDYSKVPSVAMVRYNSAFSKHDGARYGQWKGALAKGVDEEGNEVKVNASVLFPHDVILSLKADLGSKYTTGSRYNGWSRSRRSNNTQYEDSELANAQFAALPDYMEGTDMRIMPICDFSGSMGVPISAKSSVQLMDVSMGLGLYCSDRLGEGNPFYRKFIPFSDDSRLVDWKEDTFSVAAQKNNDGWCGSTNIRSALDKILDGAKMFGATNDQIPNCLLIISDMQFDAGTEGNMTSVEAGLQAWEKSGYDRPTIVYWNLAGYKTSPATVKHANVALVSGFSPSVLTAVLGGEDFSPRGIMEKAIEKYEVVDPTKPEPKSRDKVVAKKASNKTAKKVTTKKAPKKNK